MPLHKEINFETEICTHLASHGWLHAEGDAAHYDRPRALFTQSTGDAIDQYRFDRQTRHKGQNHEPLLGFPSGALIHFVSNDQVAMTTQLAGPASQFLP